MQPDIVDLMEFYQQRRGQWAQRVIMRQIFDIWPDNTGARILGVGYATPYLDEFHDAERRIALMPALQGITRWPRNDGNRAFLTREDEWPLADRSIDRILIIHALECSRHAPRLLREAWRVLADGGRMITIVPNRTGLWCLSDTTPFGTGQPFSMSQLQLTLRSNLFQPMVEARALFFPPIGEKTLFRAAPAFERIGAKIMPQFSGAIILEAEKQIYAGTPATATSRARSRQYIPLPQGVAARNNRDQHNRSGS